MRNPEVNNPEQESKKPRSFMTERGSVYSYDETGRTSRFKKATNEQYEPQDLTVFLDLDDEDYKFFRAALEGQNPDLKKKIYIVERKKDDKPEVRESLNEVQDSQRLYLAVVDKNGSIIKLVKASLKSEIGKTVFDTRSYEKDGKNFRERHFGHKITKIDYE